jgi:mRNA interferase MazF
VIVVRLDPSEGHEQAKTRPCLVIQTALLARSHTTIVLPIADGSNPKPVPFVVPMAQGEAGLKKDSQILVHQIRTVDETRILEKWGTAKPQTLLAVERALKFTLELEQD